jgi:hypothetical protein
MIFLIISTTATFIITTVQADPLFLGLWTMQSGGMKNGSEEDETDILTS